MKSFDILCRRGDDVGTVRVRPADAGTARLRLDGGNRAFSALFAQFDAPSGTARRVTPSADKTSA
jgi:hypothetical protein